VAAGAAQASDAFWSSLDPYSQVRLTALATAPTDIGRNGQGEPGIGRSAGPGQASGRFLAKFYHPDNPLFWFGLIGGLTVGAMALSTGTVGARAGAHVGPVAAEAELGHEHEE
jgi:hypothetical protein